MISTPRTVALAALLLAGSSVVSGCFPAQATQPPENSTRSDRQAGPAAPASVAAPAADLLTRFMKIRTPGGATLAPDGTLFVRDWPDGVYQVYRVPGGAAKPGAPADKLTTFPDGASGYSLSPDASRLIITAAVGGNENTQIMTLDPKAPAGTPPAPITSNPKVQYSPNLWLADSSGFIYTGNDASPNDFHVYRYDFASAQSTKLLAKEGHWSAGDIADDASRLLVERYSSASDSSVHELDIASGELKDLTIRPDANSTAANAVVGYMPGARSALLLSDAQDGLRRLYLRDLASGATSRPLPQLDAHEVDEATMNHERSLLAVVLNTDGFGVLRLFALPSFQEIALPAIEQGVVSGVSLRGRQLTWSLSNARTPGLASACVVSEAGVASTPRQLTFTDTQGIDLAAFPLPRLVRFKSFDGLDIPAFLYLPAGSKDGASIPFVINYHGGPEGQHRPAFSAQFQYFLTQGFGVLLPNVRGSTGYGRAFHMMDDYTRRWDSVRDGVAAAQWLVDNHLARPGHIATQGGSYGGFMSVACLVEDTERVERGQARERLFGAGINIVGIVNLKTFLEQTSGYRRKLREAEYGPLSDPAFLESVSSIKRSDKIRVPMLIAHGLNDPRVPVGEAMQLAVALQKRGDSPELIYCPDEGHGFAKLENRLLLARRSVGFLKRTIGAN